MYLPFWIYKNLQEQGIKYKPIKGGGIFYIIDGKKKFVPSYKINFANKMASTRYCSEKEKIKTFLEWLDIDLSKD